MKTITTIITGIFCFLPFFLFSQSAPVTIAPHVYNPVVGQSFSIPVTVSNFEDIGSISLIFDYNPAVLTFQHFQPNAVFNDFVVNGATPGRVIISWYALYGVTLPEGAHLVDITFLNLGGTTALTWSSADAGFCEYAKYDDGAYTVLNDAPFGNFFINGMVSSPSAPLTWAPVISHATPGPVDVPVMVNGFNNIGAISLTLEYDPGVIDYLDLYVANPELTAKGEWLIGNQDGPGGKKYIRISWTKNVMFPALPAVNLPDSSTILTLKFNYSGGTTDLRWIDDGSSCEYADGEYNALDDTPAADYYRDGLVTGQHFAPQTVATCITGAIGQPVVLPVKVYGFYNIGTISLTLNYDPAILTWQSITSTGIPSTWTIDANGASGTFVIGAIGDAGFSLPDGSVLFTITFIYHGGSCLLTWNDDDPISCEYADGSTFLPLYDLPREDYYIDGCVGPAPVINGMTFLEGAYETASGNMTTELNSLGMIPQLQPYSSLPWEYTGSENASVIPAGITDWFLVQLRTLPAASSAIATRAGFLTKSGAITDLDGINLLGFPGIMPGYYYLVVYHRNHMAVMSSAPVQVNPFSGLYDFSAGPSGNYGGSNGLKLIDSSSSRWGMIAADASNDQNIYINDYSDYWVPDFGLNPGYSRGDYNLDGQVFIDDYSDRWVPNFGITNVLP